MFNVGWETKFHAQEYRLFSYAQTLSAIRWSFYIVMKQCGLKDEGKDEAFPGKH